MKRRRFLSLSALAATGLPSCSRKPVDPNAPVRIGHFPNVTHVQGIVAHRLSKLGKGWFEPRLGVPVEWFVYNAGPSATEAIFAGSLDVAYIGPSPALNAYAKSKGRDIRILAGAANGGSSILVRKEANIKTIADFRGKKIATPQFGNTQDVQIRALLTENGFRITQTGGDAIILPTQNADLLNLFQQGAIDAAWAPEPFASVLELEGGAVNFLEDRETNVTMLISSVAFLEGRPGLAQKMAAAHRELTGWIQANPAEARQLLVEGLTELTTKAPNPAVVDKALARTILTNDISRPSLEKMVKGAITGGFLTEFPPIEDLLSHSTP